MAPNIHSKPPARLKTFEITRRKEKMKPEDHLVITQAHSYIAFREFHFNTKCCLIRG